MDNIIKDTCYAAQVGLYNIIKDTFYDQLQDTVRKVGADETFVICDDLNRYIGKLANSYEGVHGGYGYGLRNKEGEHILEFAVAHILFVGNCNLTKNNNHLITYQSGGVNSQID